MLSSHCTVGSIEPLCVAMSRRRDQACGECGPDDAEFVINEIANVCEATVPTSVASPRESASIAVPPAGWYRFRRFLLPEGLAGAEAARGELRAPNAVIEVNELQKRRVIGKLHRHLGSLRDKRVALLGLAFKPHTDDMREAPSLVLAGPARRGCRRAGLGSEEVDGRDLHGVDRRGPAATGRMRSS